MQKWTEWPAVAGLKPVLDDWMGSCATIAWLPRQGRGQTFIRSQGIIALSEYPRIIQRQHDIGAV